MANHTDNILTISANEKTIKEIKNLIIGKDENDELIVDFNKIIPMPEELNITSGSVGDQAYTCLYGTDEDIKTYLGYQWVKDAGVKTREELIKFLEDKAGGTDGLSWRELGERYKNNKEKYGETTWYDWNIKNWGTKWNSYNATILNETETEIEVAFQTAWSAPIPVYEKLSELFEDATISAYWNDEGSYERMLVFENASCF
jgi:hypothetical protein